MEIEIIPFGKIAEFIKQQKLELLNINNTVGLEDFLMQRYPKLKEMKYTLAVNNQLVQDNVDLKDHCTIAIMPPFSGG